MHRFFRLGGLTNCEDCKTKIEDTLSQIAGVKDASLDLGRGVLEVYFDQEVVDENHLISTLHGLGYSILDKPQ